MRNQNTKSSILKYHGRSYPLKMLPEEKLQLTQIDKEILRRRINYPTLSELPEDAARVALDKMLFQYAALYGCPMPRSERLAKAISECIQEFVNEFYDTYSIEEIMYALKINVLEKLVNKSGDDIERVLFYGVFPNAMFLSKVLERYSTQRNNLDMKIREFIDSQENVIA